MKDCDGRQTERVRVHRVWRCGGVLIRERATRESDVSPEMAPYLI